MDKLPFDLNLSLFANFLAYSTTIKTKMNMKKEMALTTSFILL